MDHMRISGTEPSSVIPSQKLCYGYPTFPLTAKAVLTIFLCINKKTTDG